MGCEICGRNSCTRSFHSLEEQNTFDEIADNIKERIKSVLKCRINNLPVKNIDDVCLIPFDSVMDIIDSY